MPQIISKIADFLDNRLSPTLVRDIRQLVRNRFIVVMINLYLLILTLGTLMVITTQSAYSRLEGAGAGLYMFDIVFFFIFTFIVVNLYTAVIMSQERITNDLMFTSTIKPSGFVTGKLSSALVLSFMLFSATLPFITIAYMLRGIDLRTILETCFAIGLMLLVSLSTTILVFCRTKTYVQMIGLLILYAFLCCVGIYAFLCGLVFYMLGPMMRLGFGVEWWQFVLGGAFVLLTVLLILSGAISRVAAASTNRMMPFRITYVAYMILTLGVSFIVANVTPNFENFPLFMVFVHYFFFLAMIVISTCGRDNWGLRIKRTVPSNIVLRFLLFPFYSGAINGIAWLFILAATLFGAYRLALPIASLGHTFNAVDMNDVFRYGVTGAIMTYAFCALAMAVRVRWLKRHLAAAHTWLLAIAFFGGFYTIYFTIRILLSDDWRHYGFYLEPDTIERTMLIALLWAAFATILLLPWVLRTLPNFTPKAGEHELTHEKAKKIIDALSLPVKQTPQPFVPSEIVPITLEKNTAKIDDAPPASAQ